MKSKNVLFGALLIGLAGSALAGGDEHRTMAIEIIEDDSASGKHFSFNSGDLGFDLAEMQVGESRSIVDESGQSILVTRSEDGFSINVNGETIELPNIDGGAHGMHVIAAGDDSDANVHVIRDVNVTRMNAMSGTMIVSPQPIDDATQQAIKSLLESAGYGSEVEFIDHEGSDHGQVMIKKVEKVVENPQT